jgi:serine/threonine-protein kinase
VLQLALTLFGLYLLAQIGLWVWDRTAPPPVKVPAVAGLEESVAIQMLQRVGLLPEVVAREPSDAVKKGRIISTEPAGGRVVKTGRRVRITLSSGETWTKTPDLRDMSLARAKERLAAAQLRLGRQRRAYHSKSPVDYVIGQDPSPGAKVQLGSAVNVVVSRGPAPEETPSTSDHTAVIEFRVPEGGEPQEVRIVVEDAQGEREVYREEVPAGRLVRRRVQGSGDTVRVRVYVGGSLLEERII